MNYTKTIREYCNQNKGTIFNISLELKEHFSMIPPKTFYKILNRLEDEGVLIKESHGVYSIPLDPQASPELHDQVIKYFCRGGHGMIVGYRWYNEIGITPHQEKKIEIYSNRMDTETKNIGSHHLEKISIDKFDKPIMAVIYALELIEKGTSIIELDFVKWDSIINAYLQEFSIIAFEEVITHKEYKYSTICTLSNKLCALGRPYNDVIELFQTHSKLNKDPKVRIWNFNKIIK